MHVTNQHSHHYKLRRTYICSHVSQASSKYILAYHVQKKVQCAFIYYTPALQVLSIVSHFNKTTCLLRIYVESFCRHLHPNVLMLKSVINHKKRCSPSLIPVQCKYFISLGDRKPKAASCFGSCKDRSASSGTLPSGGRS